VQDTVRPMDDMVHYLAKALCILQKLFARYVTWYVWVFVFILQKLAFCKICYSVYLFVILQKLAFCKIYYSVCLFVFFVCNHFCSAFFSLNKPYISMTSLV
jgi:hypothetical protein